MCCDKPDLVTNVISMRLASGEEFAPPAIPGDTVVAYLEDTICLSCKRDKQVWVE